MRNDTPIDPSAGEEARAQAEAALEEYGWLAITPRHRWEGELAVGLSPDQRYEISAWADTGDLSGGDTYICDVGAAFSAEKRSLWTLGIPGPDEVPMLLNEHAEIMSVGMGTYLLSLATNEVVDRVAERDRRLASIRDTLKTAWRALNERGWETYEGRYAVCRVADPATRPVEIFSTPLYTEDSRSLLLDVNSHYVDTRREVQLLEGDRLTGWGVATEQYGRARFVLSLPGGAEDIPTPQEAMRIMRSA